MPFITEELWARTSETPRDTLADPGATGPIAEQIAGADAATAEMHWVIDLIKGIRSVRAEMNVPAGAKIPMLLTGANDATPRRGWSAIKDVILTLARLTAADIARCIPKGSAQFVLEEAVVALPLGDVIDFAKERARLEKDLKKAQEEIARFDAKLSQRTIRRQGAGRGAGRTARKARRSGGAGGAAGRSDQRGWRNNPVAVAVADGQGAT